MNTLTTLGKGIAVDNVTCQAFNFGPVVGSKVVDKDAFLSHLEFGIKSADFSTGSSFIALPETAFESVCAGEGEHTHRPEDYVVRRHRNHVSAFLIRSLAGPVRSLGVVVYTREGYENDPEVTEPVSGDISHIIVAVIAASAPEAPLTPYRLVSNIAGGNNDFILPDDIEEQASMAKSWVKKAKASKEYWDKYCVVAD